MKFSLILLVAACISLSAKAELATAETPSKLAGLTIQSVKGGVY